MQWLYKNRGSASFITGSVDEKDEEDFKHVGNNSCLHDFFLFTINFRFSTVICKVEVIKKGFIRKGCLDQKNESPIQTQILE